MKVPFIKCREGGGVYFRAPSLGTPHRFGARGCEKPSCLSARQVHSDTVLYVTQEDDYTADGLITDRAGLSIAVKTADCTPVLMYDKNAGAAAAIHAGWRGTAAGIVLRAYEKMLSIGAGEDSVRVAVGPSICFDCYEVKEDFRDAVRRGLGGRICDMFVREKENRLHADVTGMNAQLLREAGIPDGHIEESGLCTCCLGEIFYSYRRDGGIEGCQWNIIAVPEREG